MSKGPDGSFGNSLDDICDYYDFHDDFNGDFHNDFCDNFVDMILLSISMMILQINVYNEFYIFLLAHGQ